MFSTFARELENNVYDEIVLGLAQVGILSYLTYKKMLGKSYMKGRKIAI